MCCVLQWPCCLLTTAASHSTRPLVNHIFHCFDANGAEAFLMGAVMCKHLVMSVQVMGITLS
jgi:hypothetical protein